MLISWLGAALLVLLAEGWAAATDLAPALDGLPSLVRSSDVICQATRAELIERTELITVYRVAVARVIWRENRNLEIANSVYLAASPESRLLQTPFVPGTVVFASGPVSPRVVARWKLSPNSPVHRTQVFKLTSDTIGKLPFRDDVAALESYLRIVHRPEPNATDELQWSRRYRQSPKSFLRWLSVTVLSDLAHREGRGSPALNEFKEVVLSEETDPIVRSRAMDYAKWCGHEWAQELLMSIAANDRLPEPNRVQAVNSMTNYLGARPALNSLATSDAATAAMREEATRGMAKNFALQPPPTERTVIAFAPVDPQSLLNDFASNDYQRQLAAAKQAHALVTAEGFTEDETNRLNLAVRSMFERRDNEPLKIVFMEALANVANDGGKERSAAILGEVAMDQTQSSRVRGLAILTLQRVSQEKLATVRDQLNDPTLKRLAGGR